MKRKIDSYRKGEIVNGVVFIEHLTYGTHRKSVFLCAKCGEKTIKRFDNVSNGNAKHCKKCVGIIMRDAKTPGKSYRPSTVLSLKKSAFRKIRKSAKDRGKFFNISFEFTEKEIVKNCNYCGCKPDQLKTNKEYSFYHHGLDRVNNEIGYIESNVVSCCKICNRAKNNLKLTDFIEWINNLKKHTNG